MKGKKCSNKRSKNNAGNAISTGDAPPAEPEVETIARAIEEQSDAHTESSAPCGGKRKRGAASNAKAGGGAKSKASSPKELIPKNLRVVDLRQELRARGISGAGLKAQLIARLEVALEEERMLGPSGAEMPEVIMEVDDEVSLLEGERQHVYVWGTYPLMAVFICLIPKELEEASPAKPAQSVNEVETVSPATDQAMKKASSSSSGKQSQRVSYHKGAH